MIGSPAVKGRNFLVLTPVPDRQRIKRIPPGKVQESGSLIGRFFGSTFPDGARGIARGIQAIGVEID